MIHNRLRLRNQNNMIVTRNFNLFYPIECGALLPIDLKACPYCGKVKLGETKKDTSKAKSGRKPETPRKEKDPEK